MGPGMKPCLAAPRREAGLAVRARLGDAGRCLTTPFPVQIPIAGADIPAHLVLEVLAYTLGYRFYARLRRRRGDRIGDTQRGWIFIGAALGALVGSRLLGALEHPDLSAPAALLADKSIVGGLLGGLVVVEWTKRRIGVTASSGDLMVYPLLLALMIGRLGCFSAGVWDGTHGLPSALPWALDLGDGVLRHPTMLYELGFLAALWAALRRIEARRPLADGALFKLFMVAYLAFRLVSDGLKPRTPVISSLSAIQLACLLGLAYYHRVWTRPRTLLSVLIPGDSHART